MLFLLGISTDDGEGDMHGIYPERRIQRHAQALPGRDEHRRNEPCAGRKHQDRLQADSHRQNYRHEGGPHLPHSQGASANLPAGAGCGQQTQDQVAVHRPDGEGQQEAGRGILDGAAAALRHPGGGRACFHRG